MLNFHENAVKIKHKWVWPKPDLVKREKHVTIHPLCDCDNFLCTPLRLQSDWRSFIVFSALTATSFSLTPPADKEEDVQNKTGIMSWTNFLRMESLYVSYEGDKKALLLFHCSLLLFCMTDDYWLWGLGWSDQIVSLFPPQVPYILPSFPLLHFLLIELSSKLRLLVLD